MAITSAGYDGTVDEPAWSDLLAMAGGRQYGVLDANSWKASIGTADREVRLSPGRGFGYGVRDVSDADASVVLPAATSGSRWDLIAMRRDWGANQSAFRRVAGSAAREIPADRATTPSVLDDQPLWLVRVDAGKSQIQALVDLRVWGGDGGALAVDELVLQYLNRLGTSVRIGDVIWQRVTDSVGAAVWSRSWAGDTGWVNVPANDNSWSNAANFGYRGLAVRRVGARLTLEGTFVRNAPVLAGYVGAILPQGFRPSSRVLIPSQRDSLEVSANPDGTIAIYGETLPANTPIIVAGSWLRD